MLSVIMLSDTMLSVVMLNVAALIFIAGEVCFVLTMSFRYVLIVNTPPA
jgi:hypothetical protein